MKLRLPKLPRVVRGVKIVEVRDINAGLVQGAALSYVWHFLLMTMNDMRETRVTTRFNTINISRT